MGETLETWNETETLDGAETVSRFPVSNRLRTLSNIGIGRFLDSFGDVRLENLWNGDRPFLDVNTDLEKIVQLYKTWVLKDEYSVMKVTQGEDVNYMALKLAKRGNDCYVNRVKRGLKNLESRLKGYLGECREGETNTLYITPTCDPKIYGNDIEIAWKSIGKDWNLFKSKLRKEYGKTLEFRSWEAFEKGFPHIHSIIVFRQKRFSVVDYGNDKPKRIPRYQKDKIAKMWHSFVDVQAIDRDNVERRVHDVAQYVAKFCTDHDYRRFDKWPIKRKRTLAILWYFGLRSFGISKELKLTMDQDRKEIPLEFINEFSTTKTRITIEFLGIVGAKGAKLDPNEWVIKLEGRPEWINDIWKPKNMRVKPTLVQETIDGETDFGDLAVPKPTIPRAKSWNDFAPWTLREKILYSGDPFRGLTEDEMRILNSEEGNSPCSKGGY